MSSHQDCARVRDPENRGGRPRAPVVKEISRLTFVGNSFFAGLS